MRIATLQFSPELGNPDANVQTVEGLIARKERALHKVDLLVLPEMAFSGYNFQSLEAIAPFLEPTCQGRSTLWAKETALRFHCFVCVGYPEVFYARPGICYNSQVMVNRKGQIVKHHRKAFLYYTDETWAEESFDGWLVTSHPDLDKDLQDVAFGICMDINPYKFEAPWDAFEFTTFCMRERARVIVLSMAWLTQMPLHLIKSDPLRPDSATVDYWYKRFKPLLTHAYFHKEEIYIVFANRCGTEPGTPGSILACTQAGHVAYAGSSCIMKFDKYGAYLVHAMGRGQEDIGISDTTEIKAFHELGKLA